MLFVAGVVVGSVLAGVSSSSPSCLRAPVSAPIVQHFIAPSCPYCAGHRTLDFSVATGIDVVAPISGVVTFAGEVAGTGYVTITPELQRADVANFRDALDGDTLLVTIGGVDVDATVVAGAGVVAGSRIGLSRAPHVRLSLRLVVEGGPARYLDPEPSLLRWRHPIRLVPDPSVAHSRARTVRRIWSCRRPVRAGPRGLPEAYPVPLA